MSWLQNNKPIVFGVVFVILVAVMVTVLFDPFADEETTNKQDQEMVTIGVINLGAVLDPIFDGFKDGMTEHGYIEGETVTYIYNGAVGDITLMDAEAQKMVDADVDLIVAISTPAAQAAQRLTIDTDIPVLFLAISNPIGAGLVDNLVEPDGNLTGLTHGTQEGLRLEWLTKLQPDMQKIWIPYNAEDQSPVLVLAGITEVAGELNVELVPQVTTTKEEIEAALSSPPADDIDGIYLLPDSVVVSNADLFIAYALEYNLPLCVPSPPDVENGALVSYSFDFYVSGQQGSVLADKILDGTDVKLLPVEFTEFFLTLNLQTAEAIGLEVPDGIVRQADTVFRE